MEPIWQLLRTVTKEDGWNATHKGCLRSVMAKRQFPQTRVKSCGWSSHDKCLLCLSAIVDAEILDGDNPQQQQQQPPGDTSRSDRLLSQQPVPPADCRLTCGPCGVGSVGAPGQGQQQQQPQQQQRDTRTFKDEVIATDEQIERAPEVISCTGIGLASIPSRCGNSSRVKLMSGQRGSLRSRGNPRGKGG